MYTTPRSLQTLPFELQATVYDGGFQARALQFLAGQHGLNSQLSNDGLIFFVAFADIPYCEYGPLLHV